MSGTGITIAIFQVTDSTCQAHKKFLYLSEPVGSSIPKFSSKMNLVAFEEKVENSVALTCPTQGSPLPSFRLGLLLLLCMFFISSVFFLEPVGGTAPRFSSTRKSESYQKPSGLALSLSCPAQASPLPSFR